MSTRRSDGTILSGEARLALAIVEDAILTVRLTSGVRNARGQRLAAEAWAWLASRDRRHPFAFENLCDYLGVDPGWLRRGLRRYAACRMLDTTAAAFSRSSRPRTPATKDRQRAAS